MGKIRGTLHMRRYIFVLLATAKFSAGLLFSKTMMQKKGLEKKTRLAWAQEVTGSNLAAPTNLFCDLEGPLKSPSPLVR
jgi:hypothetical protein